MSDKSGLDAGQDGRPNEKDSAVVAVRALPVADTPFAYFQRHPITGTWEEVVPSAAGQDGVVAAYTSPQPDQVRAAVIAMQEEAAQSLEQNIHLLTVAEHAARIRALSVDQIIEGVKK